MKLISDLNTLCEKGAVNAGYPSGVRADFAPYPDEGMGELFSDIAIRYADPLRCPPEKVVAAICNGIEGSDFGQFFPVRGYVNCTLKAGLQIPLSDITRNSLQPGEKFRIVLPQPYESLNGGAFLRIASRAIAQALCAQALGVTVQFEIGSFKETISGNSQDWIVGLAKHCKEIALSRETFSTQGEWEARIYEAVNDTFDGRSFFWLLPSAIRNGMVTECVQLCAARGCVRLCGVERKWAAIPPDDLAEVFVGTTTRQFLAEIYHLASTLPSEELDLSVPSLNEKSNLVWYYEISRTRLERWQSCTRPFNDNSVIELLPESHSLRTLQIGALFFPTMRERAALYGAVPEYLTWTSELLSSVHRILNTPQLRASLGAGGEGEVEVSKILSFAYHIMSAMVVLN